MVTARGSGPVRAPVIGIALSASRLTAVWSAANGTLESREFPTDSTGGDSWVALRDALREAGDGWRASWGEASCTMRIALLAPLVEVRTVSLPPVSTYDAIRLLARAPARHFLAATEPVTVGVSTPVTIEAGATTRVAAAAPVRLIRALREAVTAAGGTLAEVVPALVTSSLGEATPRAMHGVIEASDTLFELVTWQTGAPIALRRFANPDDLAALCEACAALDGTITLSANAPERTVVASALAQRGVSVAHAHVDAPAALVHSAAARAAWRLASIPWLPTAEALPLALAEDMREAPAQRAGASTSARRRMALTTGLLLLATAGVYRVGVLRELHAVRTERAALAPVLDSLGLRARSNDPLALERAVLEEARTAVPWAQVMARLGMVLPRDAHVLGLRATGDTIELDGVARDAGGVFTALEEGRFSELAAVAPVRRDRSANGDVTERFTFRARAPHRQATLPDPRVAEGTP